MKIVFLGSFTPKEEVETLRANSSFFDVPGNVLQNALINGFDAGADLRIITSPNLKGLQCGRLDSFEFSHNGTVKDFCVGYKDTFLVREFSVAKEMYNDLNKCEDVDVIFIYSISAPLLYAANKYKKSHPSVKIIEMITDLPQFMRDHPSLGYKVAKRIETSINFKLMKCVDGFAPLSLAMADQLPFGDKSVVQIEGIFDSSSCKKCDSITKQKSILYSGNLGKRYGILDLLDAFTRTKLDYKLWICGIGDGSEDVRKYALKDNRIEFLGSLPRTEVLRLQREASLLINPRHRTDAFTKYSFPSKTMEYMASGTPTLMSELVCLPEDYKQHLYFFDDESVDGMAKKMEEICTKPQAELDAFGKAASEFILNHKNAEAQVRKMLNALGC